jgi:endonuclease YncB( thermonuclease family)
MKVPAWSAAVIVVLGCCIPAATVSGAESSPARQATVVSVVDGDTLRIRTEGRTGTIDLIGIRAPTGSACFANAARSKLRALLRAGTRIRVTDETRVSGRGRYVRRGTKNINVEMLRTGNARLGGLTRVSRAAALRSAERAAREARRGLHGACGTGPTAPAPTTPAPAPAPAPTVIGDPQPGPVPQADRIRTALAGRVLTQLTSDSNSSTRNDTNFCADGRVRRTEDFNASASGGGFSNVTFDGSWVVLDTKALADGSINSLVFIRPDDPAFDARTLSVTLRADGKVDSPFKATTQDSVAPTACSPPPAGAPTENDTPAARSQFLTAIGGGRFEAGGRTTDICPGPRFVRREGGQVVADGTLVIEWALSNAQGRLGVLRVVDDARKTSRRMLIEFPSDGRVLVQEFARDDPGGAITKGVAVC